MNWKTLHDSAGPSKLFHPVLLISSVVFITFFYNEFLIYYITISSGCRWPTLSDSSKISSRIFVIADLHLLGIYRGHWFDKLRREWQMYRSFQTALHLLKPDAVFFLGDQFDEGLLGANAVFKMYVERFDELMYVPEGTRRFVLAGNHDIGFHDEISSMRLDRFSENYNSTFVSHVLVGTNHFVMINSMAMEQDGCRLCQEAKIQLELLRQRFECMRKQSKNCSESFKVSYSRPVLMQHFPLFRSDDSSCGDDADTAPELLKSQKFRERLDCLSADSTEQILKALNPRAVFDGHTHFACKTWWPEPYGIWEWTVPSFSWRNTAQPSFLLVTLSESEILVNKCLLPKEKNVIYLYIATAVLSFSYFSYAVFLWFKSLKRTCHPTYEVLSVKAD